MTPTTLSLKFLNLTDEQFYWICQENPDIRLERNASGELIVMPPTGWETGNRNIRLSQRLANWTDADGTGIAFDSSTGFKLPNGANRSPDAAWVKLERLNALNPDPDKFLPLAPDFVVELMSASDTLEQVQAKMQEYIENGVRLGWLINPKSKLVEVYRWGEEVEVLRSPTMLSGENVLSEFLLDLQGILF
jgi:Uma2 family endonuclease